MATVVLVGVAVLVALSIRDAAVPVGGSSAGGTEGPGLALALTDLDGRPLALPGGRPGVLVLVSGDGCQRCRATTQAALAATGATPSATLTLFSVDPYLDPAQLRALGRGSAPGRVRYAIDDRNGTVGGLLPRSGLGTALVFTTGGAIVGKSLTRAGDIRRAVERALARSASESAIGLRR